MAGLFWREADSSNGKAQFRHNFLHRNFLKNYGIYAGEWSLTKP